MKSYKKTMLLTFILTAAFGSWQFATAQKTPTAKEIAVKNLVDSQQYIFYAQSVTPMTGRQRFLTSEYTLKVLKDTVVCDLPFFGRAYTAPMNPSDGGIHFTSTNFDYKLATRKKGGWDVSIKPKDGQDVQQLTMTIFDNGDAYLQLTSNSRQAISFNGYIAGKKIGKKKLTNNLSCNTGLRPRKNANDTRF